MCCLCWVPCMANWAKEGVMKHLMSFIWTFWFPVVITVCCGSSFLDFCDLLWFSNTCMGSVVRSFSLVLIIFV